MPESGRLVYTVNSICRLRDGQPHREHLRNEMRCSLFRGDPVANLLVSGAGENVFIEQVVFIAVRSASNDSARGGAIDARKIQKLTFGSGVEIDERVLAIAPAIADAFGGGASFVGGLVGGFA
jgi:hypothetical protein